MGHSSPCAESTTRSYYWIKEDGDYHNWTGCGNTLNLSHPRCGGVCVRVPALLG
ncbi:glycogen debranching enzyme [Citrobacter koseri]|uniref:Glycogen debranching enzyme n=1 Tax=Citrobacter koseri TaxID=545 RepID=A0A2X2YED4_CITKO|nr:glycogen debranching enzyme [Citrobacter koseri]